MTHTSSKSSSDDARAQPAGFLAAVERMGNKIPDPALLFVVLIAVVWGLSWLLSAVQFAVLDPRTGEPIVINNQLSGEAITMFFSKLVSNFAGFGPVGTVLVAMLGIGVAESTGFINTCLRALLSVTPKLLLTPMIVFVGIVSHSAVDAGYVLVIPLGGLIFYGAGRHPLAGIAAAFAGVSGGFSANPAPSSLDPLLQSLTQVGARILDPNIEINPLNNYYFTALSSFLIVILGWYLTDRVVEPRLKSTEVDGDLHDLPSMNPLEAHEQRGMWIAMAVMGLGFALVVLTALPAESPWRNDEGVITNFNSPLMRSIVTLIFLGFLVPGIVYGLVAGTIRSSKDVIGGMTKAMESMAYYLVIMFFIAQFVYVFNVSNLGALMALQGAELLRTLGLPWYVTIVGIVLLTGFVNIFVGSASGKWGLLAPIFVPMLMTLGISPDLTQAAYRVGDSSTNIITPLMPYFPLVVIYCQRYVKSTGIGTLAAMMLPYSISFLVAWTVFLLLYTFAGIPLGILATYTYPAN